MEYDRHSTDRKMDASGRGIHVVSSSKPKNENGKIVMFSQRIENLYSGKETYGELLIREYRGLKGADEIIQSIVDNCRDEEFDLEVIKEISKNSDKYLNNHDRIGINLCKRTLLNNNAFEVINRELDWIEDKSRVIMEITEHTKLDNENVKRNLKRLRSEGYKIALDDFGTSKSNIASLIEMDIDYIKLDKQFVRNDGENWERKIILMESILRMSDKLGIETIVEGIETAEQLRIIKEIGFSNVQGYYIQKPKPIEEINTVAM